MVRLGSDIETGASIDADAQILTDGCLIVGDRGTGKTTLARRLLRESAAAGLPCLAFDTTGDLTRSFFEDGNMSVSQGFGAIRRHSAGMAVLVHVDLVDMSGLFARPSSMSVDESPSANELHELILAFVALLGFRPRDRTPEFLLLETLVFEEWRQGRDVSLADLADLVAKPRIGMLGVFELDAVISSSRRDDLANAISTLLVSFGGQSDVMTPQASIEDVLGEDGVTNTAVVSFERRPDRVQRFLAAVILVKVKNRIDESVLVCFDEAVSFFPRNQRTVVSRFLHGSLLSGRGAGINLVLMAEQPDELHEDVEDLCQTWFVGRMPVSTSRRQVVEALDLVDPPVDEFALDLRLKELIPGQFVLRSSRLRELRCFQVDQR